MSDTMSERTSLTLLGSLVPSRPCPTSQAGKPARVPGHLEGIAPLSQSLGTAQEDRTLEHKQDQGEEEG